MSQWNYSRRSRSRQPSANTSWRGQLDGHLLKAVDLGLAAVIFVGPHLFGGRHMLGRFVILSLCVVTALAWCTRQFYLDRPRWTRTPGLGLLLVAIAWVSCQLIPLPDTWHRALAPHHAEILPLWNSSSQGVSLGQWQTLTLSPEDTRLALATLVAYGLLFITVVQRLETFDDVKRITRWVATSAFVVAVFGVIQYFTANGKFFWFYEHPYAETLGDLKAGFTSRNHCAHFMVLGLANAIAWTMLSRNSGRASRSRSRQHWAFAPDVPAGWRNYASLALTIAATLLVFAILATLSRGGTLAMISALGVTTAIYARARLLNSSHVLAGTVLLLVLLGALSFSGSYDKLARRMDSLTTASVEQIDVGGGRRKIWAANVAAFQASCLTGWGAGSHRFVYPLFIGEAIPSEFTHAENGYLQIATEHGLPGLIMLAVALAFCGWWCIRAIAGARDDRPRLIVATGVTAALTASVIHSIVDFVWFIPACMAVTVILAACASRLAQLAADKARISSHQLAVRPLTRFNLALATALAGVWLMFVTYPAASTALKWDAYLRADQALKIVAQYKTTAQAERREQFLAAEALNTAALTENLVAVVRNYPACARAHVRLAGMLLNRFEQLQQQSDNAMTIGQIREAAVASNFSSADSLRQWLDRAFGKNSNLLFLARRHALHAVRLCPLQGEAYLYLAELAFLEGRRGDGYTAYAQQALRVRPDDSDVLFAIGKNSFISGNVDDALQLWSRAYQGAGSHQFHIMNVLAGHMSAEMFLETFAPDWRSLELLWSTYRQAGTLSDLQAILPYARQQAERQTPDLPASLAGKIWHDLARMQLEMNDPQAALASLQRSHAVFPESANTRRQLAKCFMQFGEFAAAEGHLRWCAQRYPESPIYRAELLQATRGKMQQLARTTQTSVN